MQKIDEKLLEIAATFTQGRAKAKSYTEIEKFINKFGLKKGTIKIEALRIWFLYKDWRKRKIAFKQANFFIELGKYFEKKQTADGIFYLLEEGPFDLTSEGFWKYRARIRHEKSQKKRIRSRRKNKENKKKPE